MTLRKRLLTHSRAVDLPKDVAARFEEIEDKGDDSRVVPCRSLMNTGVIEWYSEGFGSNKLTYFIT